eukprot:Opistho-2@60659
MALAFSVGCVCVCVGSCRNGASVREVFQSTFTWLTVAVLCGDFACVRVLFSFRLSLFCSLLFVVAIHLHPFLVVLVGTLYLVLCPCVLVCVLVNLRAHIGCSLRTRNGAVLVSQTQQILCFLNVFFYIFGVWPIVVVQRMTDSSVALSLSLALSLSRDNSWLATPTQNVTLFCKSQLCP